MINTSTYPTTIYIKEIKWRFLYSLLSFFLVFSVAFLRVESLYIIEIHPFIKYSHKKFIATHITELFDSAVQMSYFVACIGVFPLVLYHTLIFFTACWFAYQVFLLRLYAFYVVSLNFAIFFFTNVYLLPMIFCFFTQWETLINNILLQVELDIRIYSYLLWANCIYSSVNSFFLFFSTIFIFFLLFTKPNYFYLFVKFYKNQLLFLNIAFFMVVLPPDFWTQFVIVGFSIFIVEFIFLLSCFRTIQVT